MKLPSKCVMYVLEGGGLVKIGMTTDLVGRVKAHQVSSPVPLELVGLKDDGQVQELAHHDRFAAYRRHGEWFDLPPDLRAAFFAELRRPIGLDFGTVGWHPEPLWRQAEAVAFDNDFPIVFE